MVTVQSLKTKFDKVVNSGTPIFILEKKVSPNYGDSIRVLNENGMRPLTVFEPTSHMQNPDLRKRLGRKCIALQDKKVMLVTCLPPGRNEIVLVTDEKDTRNLKSFDYAVVGVRNDCRRLIRNHEINSHQ